MIAFPLMVLTACADESLSPQEGVVTNHGGPNEPLGLEQIFYLDGTTREIGTQWEFGTKWTDGRHVVVVDDTTAPNRKALEHRWFPGEGAGGAGAAYWNTFGSDPGPQSEIYFRALVKWNPGWQHHVSGTNKIFYSGMKASTRGGGGASQLVYSYEAQPYENAWNAGPPGGFVIWDQSGDPGDTGWYFGPPEMKKVLRPGIWHTLEIRLRSQSAPGAADGLIQAWVDGREVVRDARAVFVPVGASDVRFDGLQILPYWGGGDDVKRVQPYDWFRWGELYLSGKP